MLCHLSIKHLAVVEQLELSFNTGMTVFTGETGAGKSILIDALGLTLGERADSSLVRAGSALAEVTAIYDLCHLPKVKSWLAEQELLQPEQANPLQEQQTRQSGITSKTTSKVTSELAITSLEPFECIIRRTISADGKSRSFINGSAVPLHQVKELGELLVNIHGQHQHQSLLKSDYQRVLLDEYGNHIELCLELKQSYQNYQKLIKMQKELLSLQGQQDKLTLLQYQIQELDELNLQENELQNLEDEQRKLNHADEWLSVCDSALGILQNEDENHPAPILGSMTQVNTLLSSLKVSHPSLKNCRELLSQALIHLEEGCNELSFFKESISINPERLEIVENRLSQIHALARKHRVGPENLLQHHIELKAEAQKLEHIQTSLNQSSEKIKEAELQYLAIAKRLSKARQNTGKQLASLITEKMQTLEMPKGRFEIQVNEKTIHEKTIHEKTLTEKLNYEKTKNHFSPDGLDEIEFLVSTNPGLPIQPLRKIASGGELSRLSLAIQVITAEKLTTPTLIFDEVDVGISGKTATIVGQLLRQLGQETQVLCVTHLPQVAANGQQHYLVEKQQKSDSTITNIRHLEKDHKIMEVARLMAGAKITQNTIAHAKELLEEI